MACLRNVVYCSCHPSFLGCFIQRDPLESREPAGVFFHPHSSMVLTHVQPPEGPTVTEFSGAKVVTSRLSSSICGQKNNLFCIICRTSGIFCSCIFAELLATSVVIDGYFGAILGHQKNAKFFNENRIQENNGLYPKKKIGLSSRFKKKITSTHSQTPRAGMVSWFVGFSTRS